MASEKEQIWLSEYLKTFNAAEAARRAGYKWPHQQGAQKKAKFRAEIDEILHKRAMTPEEIIDELQQIAQGDLADFMDIHGMGFNLTLEEAKEKGKTKLLKKVRQKTTIFSGRNEEDDREVHDLDIEMYSRHEALRDLAKLHSLFIERKDITSGGEKIKVILLEDADD